MVAAANAFTTVIVPVRDNAEGVREVIACLSAQTVGLDDFEVIVSDDGSRHDPLTGLAVGDGWLTVVAGPPSTSYAARNRAIRAARGEVIAFCDSDCRPEPDWLEQGLAAIADSDIVAGEVALDVPDRPTVWSLLTIDQFLHQRRAVRLGVAATANLFVARSVFERVGDFDESLPSGGDWAFVRRATAAGASLGYAPRAVVRHSTIDTARALLRKVWFVNRWDENRRARDHVPFFETKGALLAVLVPWYTEAMYRRRTFRAAASLDLERLAEVEVSTSRRQRVWGIAVLYTLLVGTVRLAQLYGRVAGWRIAGGHRPASIRSVGGERIGLA